MDASIRVLIVIASLLGFGYFFWRFFKIISLAQKFGKKKLEFNLFNGLINILKFAFGHKKMIQKPIAGLTHFFVLFAFICVNFLLLEIYIEAFFGVEKAFYKILGPAYASITFLGDFFGVAGLIGILIFIIRRYVVRPFQFKGHELTLKSHIDALVCLVAILLLLSFFVVYNWSESILFSFSYFPFSNFIGSLIIKQGDTSLVERLRTIGLIGHLCVVWFFLFYLPHSKHFHILTAFAYLFYYKPLSNSEISIDTKLVEQVKNLLDGKEGTAIDLRYGAKEIKDLDAVDILGSFACTQCGRCTAECPAATTGKKLSPRKIMMDVRKISEIIMKNPANTNISLHDYISKDEVFACTTCMACVQACPINLRPLDIILKIRNNLLMEKGEMPQNWVAMINALQGNGSPWQMPTEERNNWIKTI